MPKYNFRNVGARILESENGDFMLCDSTLRFDTIIVREAIESSGSMDSMALMIGKQVVNFLKKQREARFKIAEEKIKSIEIIDSYKAKLLRIYLKEGNLRKVEKDVYFFFNDKQIEGPEIQVP
jgi:hypothetical protein